MRVRGLIAAGTLGVLSGCYNEALPYRDLAQRAQVTEGRVFALDCRNHGTVVYQFEVDGQKRGGVADFGVVNCGTARVGDPVRVFYDPQITYFHTLRQPEQLYEDEHGWHLPPWIALPLVFSVGFILEAVTKSRGWDEKPGRGTSRPAATADRSPPDV